MHADKVSMSAVADWKRSYLAETSDGREGVNDGESAALLPSPSVLVSDPLEAVFVCVCIHTYVYFQVERKSNNGVNMGLT